MLPGTYGVSSQNGVSTYGLNTADTPVFPDIPEHGQSPSQLRLAHDRLAINSEFRLKPVYLVEYLISGAGGIDPDTEIDDDTYAYATVNYPPYFKMRTPKAKHSAD